MRKLEIGVGNKKKIRGSIGLDIVKTPEVDVLFDLNYPKFPFKDNVFDEVYCFHILEHLDDLILIMNEIHRICKNNGKVEVVGPHFTCNMGFADPTHKRFFSFYTFDYFALNPNIETINYYTENKFKIIRKKIMFRGHPPFRTFKNLFFNRFPRFYEESLAFIFPCHSVGFELKVVK